MITLLAIENFKAIRERVEVPLGPFTVLVGPNDAGKSTILQALDLLSRATDGGHVLRKTPQLFERELADYLPDHDRGRELQLAVRGTIDTQRSGEGGSFSYRIKFGFARGAPALLDEHLGWNERPLFSLPASNQGSVLVSRATGPVEDVSLSERDVSILSRLRDSDPAKFHPLRAIADDMAARLVKLEAHKIAEAVPIDHPLHADGLGLVNVVDEILSGPERARISVVEALLRRLAPDLQTVTTKRIGNKKELHFLLGGDQRNEIPAGLVSDGVLLATCLALLVAGLRSPRLLNRRTRKRNHPRLLGAIVETLRDAGRITGTQIVVTTHSPILLNHVEPEEVLLVTRPPGGPVHVTPMTDTRFFEERIKDFSLGELWYNVGERQLTVD